MNKITGRLIDTDSTSAITAYEASLDKLETQKALMQENLAKPVRETIDFDNSFRPAKTTSPFKVLAALSGDEKGMADLQGEIPNLFDDVFRDLEDWEAILKALPDVNVGNSKTYPQPPEPSP